MAYAYNAAFGALHFRAQQETRYVFRIAFSDDASDDLYVRSHGDIDLSGVSGATTLDARLRSVSVVSQSLDVSSGASQIGKMSFTALDHGKTLTTHQRFQLNENHSARFRDVQLFKGFKDLPWSSYELVGSQLLQSVRYRDGEYRFQCRDVQRAARAKILAPIELRLAQELSETDTTIELVSTTDSQGRKLESFVHDSGFTDRPGQNIAYVKIDDEIIAVNGANISANQLTSVGRGALGTRAEAHTLGSGRGKKVTEVPYLEGAFPRVAHALLTGVWLGNAINDTLPDHWHAGMPSKYVRTSDFLEVGADWLTLDPTEGLPVVIQDPGEQDAKRYIEREICRVFSAFMPVYNDGSLGFRRSQTVLSTAAPVGTIDDSHLTRTVEITYSMDKVVNDLLLRYQEIDGEFVRQVPVVDPESIEVNQRVGRVEFDAALLPSGRYSPEALGEIIKRYRDRLAFPPIETVAVVKANGQAYEIGDVVRLKTKHALVYTENEPAEGGLDHAFEVQQVSENLLTGEVSYRLFGSSREASDLPPDFSGFAVPEALYTSAGSNIAGLPGVQDVGAAYRLPDGLDFPTGRYYADKDIEIPSGSTVTINGKQRWWIKGVVQCFGKIDGKGRGFPGSDATVNLSGIPPFGGQQIVDNPPATTAGIPGFLGLTQADGALIEQADQRTSSKYRYWGQSVLATITRGTHQTMPSFLVEARGNTLHGLPEDLRGTSGGGGGYKAWQDGNGPREDTMGGAGGAGGASLVCVCRGWTFGAGGIIDTSGADGQPGTLNQSHEQPAWSGGGAGGAPGGILWALDGALAPIPIKFGHVIADYGDSPTSPGNVLPEAFVIGRDTRFGPPEGEPGGIKGALVREERVSFFESATQNVRLGTAAARSVFVVPDLPAEADDTDDAIATGQVISLQVTEAYDDRSDVNVTLLRATVTPVSVTPDYASARIYSRRVGTSQWREHGFAEPTHDFELPADGNQYEVQARAILINGHPSPTGVASQIIVTDSNRISAAPTDISSQAGVELLNIKVQIPNTLGKPDFVRLYRSAIANDANPGKVKTEPVFFNADLDAFCTVDLVDASVMGGTQYYYWADAVNETGVSARYPAGDGIPAQAVAAGDGVPGEPGADAVVGEVRRITIKQRADGSFDKSDPQTVVVQWARGNSSNIGSHNVTLSWNADGEFDSVNTAASGGEATAFVTSDPLGKDTMTVELRHVSTGIRGFVHAEIVKDGIDAPPQVPPGVRLGDGKAQLGMLTNFTHLGAAQDGSVGLLVGRYQLPDGEVRNSTGGTVTTPFRTSPNYSPPDGRLFLFSVNVASHSGAISSLYGSGKPYSEGWILASYNTQTGEWRMINSSAQTAAFTPTEDDVIFATLSKVGDKLVMSRHVQQAATNGELRIESNGLGWKFLADGSHKPPQTTLDFTVRVFDKDTNEELHSQLERLTLNPTNRTISVSTIVGSAAISRSESGQSSQILAMTYIFEPFGTSHAVIARVTEDGKQGDKGDTYETDPGGTSDITWIESGGNVQAQGTDNPDDLQVQRISTFKKNGVLAGARALTAEARPDSNTIGVVVSGDQFTTHSITGNNSNYVRVKFELIGGGAAPSHYVFQYTEVDFSAK